MTDLNHLENLGNDIYFGQLIGKKLSTSITNAVKLLESKSPDSAANKNQFTTYAINDLSYVGGIRLVTIFRLMYERLTKEYFLKTGVSLQAPIFPNQSCTIKSQVKGQSHDIHTDGGDGDYGMGRITHSSVICLNDDYEGGHTQFYLTGTREQPNIDIDIQLKAGQALIFNADLNYHGVTEVTAGSRFSLIQFWRE